MTAENQARGAGTEHERVVCEKCAENGKRKLDFDFAMAFQPIVDLRDRSIFAHEALVRGVNGEPAGSVLSRVDDGNRYAFDQLCRVRAIETSTGLGLAERVSINFLPNAVYEPANCIRTTMTAARRCNLPLDRIIFEITEGERIEDRAHLSRIVEEYRRHGLQTAIDDFGDGHAGLNLLADLQPDIIKLDMKLTRNLDGDRVRRAIVRSTMAMAEEFGITVIAEGVETPGELAALEDLGVHLIQGFLFARPAFGRLVPVEDIVWPES